MDLHTLQVHLDSRLDELREDVRSANAKLDNHLDRISRTETDISWLRGHVRVVTTIVLAVAGFFAVAFFSGMAI